MSKSLVPPAHLPPGPPSALPQLLHLKDPFPLMDRLAARFSSPMTCPLLGQDPMVLSWDPDGLRAIQAAPPETFTSGTPEALAAIVGRGSLFLQTGGEHQRSRKLLMPPFHGERVKFYAETVARVTRRWLETLPLADTRPFLPTAQSITLDVIIEAVLGATDPEVVTALQERILALVAAFNPLVATFKGLQKDFFGLGPWAKLQRRVVALRAAIDAQVADRQQDPGDDVLSLLLQTTDEEGVGLAPDEIYQQLVTFVVAGHETTATTLCWALYELHRAPDTLRRLLTELRSHEDAPAESLDRLPYLSAVVNETLRRHPPVPIVPRRCRQSFRLGDFELPPGQSVGMAVYMAHHDERNFPHPKEFRPERFLGQKPSPLLFLPFGGGARRCLGAAFAAMELRVALATILLEASFLPKEKKPVRSTFRIGTYGPETGIRLGRVARKEQTTWLAASHDERATMNESR